MNIDTENLVTHSRAAAGEMHEALTVAMPPAEVCMTLHDALTHLRYVEESAAIIRAGAVATMRANGASWTDVGRALGISRQAAQQTYGR